MGCFGSSGKLSKKSKDGNNKDVVGDDSKNCKEQGGGDQQPPVSGTTSSVTPSVNVKTEQNDQLTLDLSKLNLIDAAKISGKRAPSFTFDQLVAATRNFSRDCLLGRGGFGKVYKGHLETTHQDVAIKRLDLKGLQGIREFVVEVLILSLVDHTNVVKLIGFCAEADQRLLVYEYLPLGSLDRHLHDLPPHRNPLDWNTRMRIAAGAARGLEYLHEKMKPPIIYRDLKCSNILLVEGYHPKLSDFGLAKVGPTGDQTHVSTRVMGTYGYCAPEYAMTGRLTFKSDVYCFGIVLLEIITGRRAVDETRSDSSENLVEWARPLFQNRKKFYKMADPLLQGQYPGRGLYQALAIACMCLREDPKQRPHTSEVVAALDYLATQYTSETKNHPDTVQRPGSGPSLSGLDTLMLAADILHPPGNKSDRG